MLVLDVGIVKAVETVVPSPIRSNFIDDDICDHGHMSPYFSVVYLSFKFIPFLPGRLWSITTAKKEPYALALIFAFIATVGDG
jgi:hypothetical protein